MGTILGNLSPDPGGTSSASPAGARMRHKPKPVHYNADWEADRVARRLAKRSRPSKSAKPAATNKPAIPLPDPSDTPGRLFDDETRVLRDALPDATPRLRKPVLPRVRSWRERWCDDTPLRTKTNLLVFLAVFTGAAVALLPSVAGFDRGPALLALLLAAVVICGLAQVWITHPLCRLAHRLERLAKTRRTLGLRDLPLSRRDEVGRIARAMHQVCLAAIRCDYDTRQLRRTMDARVEAETQKAVSLLRRMAMRDPLTELGNRRYLDNRLPEVFDAARVAGEDVACVMFDLDNFKQVNDQLGHHAGDETLVLLAGLLSAHVRSDDLAARLGGDEMCIVLPGADAERAARLADRVRELFDQQSRLMHPGGPHAGVCAGVASLRHDKPEDPKALLAAADTRLYQAKRRGKGRTCRITDD